MRTKLLCDTCTILSSCPGDVMPRTIGCEIHKLEVEMNKEVVLKQQSWLYKLISRWFWR